MPPSVCQPWQPERAANAAQELRSYTTSGKRSQPALTRYVAGLEQRLGSILFIRNSQGVEQTDLCRTLMANAGDLLVRFRAMSTRLHHARSHHDTEITVAAGTIAAETVGMAALALMLQSRRHVQIRFTSLNWLHALPYLRDREAELAIFETSECGDQPDLAIEKLRPHPGAFAARVDHPLVGRNSLTLTDILRYPMCFIGRMPDRVSQEFVTARQAAQNTGGTYPAYPAAIVESPAAALLAACNSDAVVPVTGSIVRAWLGSGEIVLLPWQEPWFATSFGIVYLRVRPPSATAVAFIECVRRADESATSDDEMLLAAVAASSRVWRSA